VIRAALASIAVPNLAVGALAAFAPRTFYDDFPFIARWVEKYPPYNEHLTTDVGAFYLGFGLLFAWAAVTMARGLILPLCAGWSVAAALHLVFHLRHLDVFSTGDAIAQSAALVAALAPALLVIALLQRPSAVEPGRRSGEPEHERGADVEQSGSRPPAVGLQQSLDREGGEGREAAEEAHAERVADLR